jgi:transposase
LSDELEGSPDYEAVMQGLFDEAYRADPHGFKDALLLARDIVGTYLAETWRRLTPREVTFAHVADIFEQVDNDILDGRFRKIIRGNFRARGIGYIEVGPQLMPQSENSHVRRN